MHTRYLFLFRAVLAATLLLYCLHAPSRTGPGWMLWATFAGYLSSAGGLWWCGSRGKLDDAGALGSFLVDVAFTSWVLYVNEGFQSEFYVAYFVVILSSCFLERLWFSFIVGAVSCLVYLWFSVPVWGALHPTLLLRASLLLVTAFFSAYVADSARRIEREVSDRYEAKLAWLQRLSIVGRAMAAVLHEAKTPLSTILLSVEQARQASRSGKKSPTLLKTIRREAERTLAVLTGFLDFTRPRELELKRLKVAMPLKKAVDSVRIHVRDRNIRLVVDCDAGAEILGSERHLVQAFTNVLLNAVEAMPLGGEIRVRGAVQGGMAEVEVVDAGVGLAPDRLAALFEPFMTSKESGHGLGLTVVRWIVQRHSGDLEVRSDGPGKGARVRIRIPVVPAPPA